MPDALSPTQDFQRADQARAAAIASEQSAADKRYQAFEGEEQSRLARETAELETTKGAVDKAMADAEKTASERPKPQPAPQPPSGPIVDAKEYEGLSYALIGMALIGGAASHGNWLGVSSTLNGALKGYAEGRQQEADKQYKDFEAAFKTQMAKEEQAEKEYEHILSDKRQTVNDMLTKLQLAGVQYGHEDVAAAARLRSIDRAQQQVEAHIQSRIAAQEHFDTVNLQVQGNLQRTMITTGASQQLTPEAEQVYNAIKTITGGKSDLTRPLDSRYGRVSATPHFNQMVSDMQAKGFADPNQIAQELVQNGVKYQGTISAYRQNLQREVAVQRLTGAVQGMQAKVQAVMKKYGLSDVRFLNRPLNELRNQVGDADYVKLHDEVLSVARLYIEAVTMPGSNAQLHATSQETSDTLISDEMTPAQIMAAFDAFNEEIGVTGNVMRSTNERLLDRLGKQDWKKDFVYQGPRAESSPRAETPTPGSDDYSRLWK